MFFETVLQCFLTDSFLFYRHALATQGFQWATNTIQKKVDELPATTDNRLVIIIMLQLKNGLLYQYHYCYYFQLLYLFPYLEHRQTTLCVRG